MVVVRNYVVMSELVLSFLPVGLPGAPVVVGQAAQRGVMEMNLAEEKVVRHLEEELERWLRRATKREAKVRWACRQTRRRRAPAHRSFR